MLEKLHDTYVITTVTSYHYRIISWYLHNYFVSPKHPKLMSIPATLVGIKKKRVNFFARLEGAGREKANEESCQEQIFCNLC